MRIIEKKYMFNQCMYTLIQNGPDLRELFSQFSKFLTFIFYYYTLLLFMRCDWSIACR